MGSFFTSTQIYNPNLLDREQFINFFCEEMTKNGYVTSNSDESEVSYILRFSDECKWVTLASEAYEQGNQLSQSDTGRIAKMLKTVCINTTVIDSDCATLDLYDKSGKKKDSLIMGRADDYFGNDIPEPIESVWAPLLEKGYSWRQLLDVQNGDYVFVEEGLSEIAPIIGMDSEGILFSVESRCIDEHTPVLNFKRTDDNRGRKLTVNAAFKQIIGDVLEPLGFVKAKTKLPYFIRVVNDDLFHIIGLRYHGSGISIVSGVATVYRKEINFDNNQRYDSSWLKPISEFYKYRHRYDSDRKLELSMMWFGYLKDDTDSLIYAFKQASNKLIEWVLPVLNQIRTPDDMIGYMFSMGGYVYPLLAEKYNPEDGYPCSDGALMLTLDDPYSFVEQEKKIRLDRALYELEHQVNGRTKEQYETACVLICNQYEKNKEQLSHILENPDVRELYLKEVHRRKLRNTEILKSYGLKI